MPRWVVPLAVPILATPLALANVVVRHGSFGGKPLELADAAAVAAYKAQAALIASGGYASTTAYRVLEATLISPNAPAGPWLVGGCIYTVTTVTGLQDGDVVRIDEASTYNLAGGGSTATDPAPFWVQVGAYTHTPSNTIDGWLVYVEPDGSGGFNLVVGYPQYNQAGPNDDLTTSIGNWFELTRDVQVLRGATLQNPLTSPRGYTFSTTGADGGTVVGSGLHTSPPLTLVGVPSAAVDDDWSSYGNGDAVGPRIFGQDAFVSPARAVRAVTAGGVVTVAAGSYSGVVLIDRPLTLTGPQAGQDGRSRDPGVDTGEAVFTTGGSDNGALRVQADNVTLDGLKIRNTVKAIHVDGPAAGGYGGLVVRNAVIVTAGDGVNLRQHGPSPAALIERNQIVDAGGSGITGGNDNGTPELTDDVVTSATIRDNTIINAAYGISGYLAGSIIRDNVVRCDAAFPGHATARPSTGGGTVVDGLGLSGQFANTLVEGNRITGYTGTAGLFDGGNAVAFAAAANRPDPAGVTLRYNHLVGNYRGFRVTAGTGLVLTNNTISGNTIGGTSTTAATVSAENNWWGHASGPLDASDDTGTGGLYNPGGLGNPVSDGIDYAPWRTAAAVVSLVPVGGPCFDVGGTLTVEVRLSGATALIRGGQFYVTYDATRLTLAGAVPGDAPFVLEVAEITPAAGELVYAVGIDDANGGQPTAADTVMARLTFTITAEACNAAGLVALPPGAEPNVTLLSDYYGEAVVPARSGLPAVTIDDSPPVVTLGADLAVNADAGVCTATRSWTPATALDACGGDLAASVTYDIDLGNNGSIDVSGQTVPSFTFPVGTHRVTARATDACGNTGSDFLLVTVAPFNEVQLDVELSWPLNGTRCVTFGLWNGTSTLELSRTVTFAGGVATGVSLLAPCASGPYSCVMARDRLHTLRRTASLDVTGTVYKAALTGADRLVGGNLNDSKYIDILDFGIFSWRYATNYGSGNTTCTTPSPHADISGDGLVTTADFTFIAGNFLMASEPPCSGARDTEGAPVTRISVAELIASGEGHLAVADLNRDGWLDELDIVAFAGGQTPPLLPRGDLNCDGVVNVDDIDPFVLAVSRPDAYALEFPACSHLQGDFTGDGLVNLEDIDGFVAALGG